MKNTRFEGYLGPRLSREVQLKRLKRVIQEALSPSQREVLVAYYFEKKNVPEIALERGVHKSTVWRTLCRAEQNLQNYLKY